MAYENLFDMLRDILAYVEGNQGCVVLSNDDPLSRRIGFCVPPANVWHVRVRNFLSRWFRFLEVKPGVLWEIGLPRLRSSLPTSEESAPIRAKVMEYLGTPDGRIKLASSLTSGVNPLV